MSTMVALTRGINRGVSIRLPMAELRRLAETIGLHNVVTWSSTGNLIFDETCRDPGTIEDELAGIIEAFGFDALVWVRTKAEWEALVARNPFHGPAFDSRRVRLNVFDRTLDRQHIELLRGWDWGGVVDQVGGREMFVHLTAPAGRIMDNLLRFERMTGIRATERTWGTVKHLHRLCQGVNT
jgi:uncharacterized protein (DUF1697 family)